MDSDDGLLLNFSEEFQPSNRAPRKVNIVKGGRWKDRRKQQLSNQGRGRTNKNRATTGSNAVPIEPRSSKINDEYSNEFSSENVRKRSANDKSSSQKRIATEARGEFGGKNNSYVSSLFTSNKSNTKLVPSGVNGDNNGFPSNAPLKDSATFSGLGLNEKLCAFLNDVMRFKAPTEIQSSVIPKILLSKRDLFVRAQTGSGKTLSILLPILNSLMLGNDHKLDRTSGLFALILTPTRELASQIYGVLETLSRCCHHIVPGIVIGGEKKKSEKARFRKGVNILVGTPGRLADHLENTKSLDSGQLRWLVLDEGDRLIELGFEETITQITNSITQNSRIHETASWEFLPKKRINILCSATMQNVDKLGSIVLDKPEMINVGLSRSKLHNEDIQLVPDQLIQEILVVPPKLRIVTLTSLLKQISKAGETKKTIVFFSCSDSVNFHFSAFTREGRILKDNKTAQDIEDESEITTKMGPLVSSNSSFFKLHGSLSQRDRIFTLNAFINSDSDHSILLCTDVASRGLDLPNITNVIEYDAPFTVEDHLHRIGRSARVGKKGEASLFLLPGSEESYVDGKIRAVHSHQENLHIGNLEDVLKDGFAVAEETVPKFKANTRRKEGDWDFHATTWHLNMERWLLEDTSAHELAAKAFTSHIRAYATHLSSERIYFNVKELHLGHIAKSFGLREAPRSIVKATEGKNKKSQKSNSENKNDDPRKKLFYMARLAEKSNNEFNY